MSTVKQAIAQEQAASAGAYGSRRSHQPAYCLHTLGCPCRPIEPDALAAVSRPAAKSLSLILPAHNEERRLPPSLRKLADYIAAAEREIEVIVVENGSTDGTASVIKEFQQTMPYLRLLQTPLPGKGRAVQLGMLAATGDYLMFCDVDFSMPIQEIDRFLDLLDGGAPVVIASRELPTSVRYGEPTRRYFMGRIFNHVVQAMVACGVKDTQCGFKAFQRSYGRTLFALQRIPGWGFDAEILYLARRLNLCVHQLGISWYYDADSRVRGISDSLAMLGEVVRIRWNDALGLYTGSPRWYHRLFGDKSGSQA